MKLRGHAPLQQIVAVFKQHLLHFCSFPYLSIKAEETKKPKSKPIIANFSKLPMSPFAKALASPFLVVPHFMCQLPSTAVHRRLLAFLLWACDDSERKFELILYTAGPETALQKVTGWQHVLGRGKRFEY